MRELNDKELIDLSKKYNIVINDIYNRDTVPSKLIEGWYIINLDKRGNPGTHWTCCYAGNTNIYFDSMGFRAPEQLDKVLKPYVFSKKEIQDLESSSCGWFCLQCIIFCGDDANTVSKRYDNFIQNYGPHTSINESKLIKFFNAKGSSS